MSSSVALRAAGRGTEVAILMLCGTAGGSKAKGQSLAERSFDASDLQKRQKQPGEGRGKGAKASTWDCRQRAAIVSSSSDRKEGQYAQPVNGVSVVDRERKGCRPTARRWALRLPPMSFYAVVHRKAVVVPCALQLASLIGGLVRNLWYCWRVQVGLTLNEQRGSSVYSGKESSKRTKEN